MASREDRSVVVRLEPKNMEGSWSVDERACEGCLVLSNARPGGLTSGSPWRVLDRDATWCVTARTFYYPEWQTRLVSMHEDHGRTLSVVMGFPPQKHTMMACDGTVSVI